MEKKVEKCLSCYAGACFFSGMVFYKIFLLFFSPIFSAIILALMSFAVFVVLDDGNLCLRIPVINMSGVFAVAGVGLITWQLLLADSFGDILTMLSVAGLLGVFIFLVFVFLKDEAEIYASLRDCKPRVVYVTLAANFLGICLAIIIFVNASIIGEAIWNGIKEVIMI